MKRRLEHPTERRAQRRMIYKCQKQGIRLAPEVLDPQLFVEKLGLRPGPEHRLTRLSTDPVLSLADLAWRKDELQPKQSRLPRPPSLRARYQSEQIAWANIKASCSNPKSRQYPKIGALGIKVCPQWMNSFAQFLKDVGPKPSPMHWLGRLDETMDYSPENVVWNPPKLRSSLRLQRDGLSREERLKISTVAAILKIRPSALKTLLALGLLSSEQLFALLPSSTPTPAP